MLISSSEFETCSAIFKIMVLFFSTREFSISGFRYRYTAPLQRTTHIMIALNTMSSSLLYIFDFF